MPVLGDFDKINKNKCYGKYLCLSQIKHQKQFFPNQVDKNISSNCIVDVKIRNYDHFTFKAMVYET